MNDPAYRDEGEFRHGCVTLEEFNRYQVQCVCGWRSVISNSWKAVHEQYAGHLKSPLVRKLVPLGGKPPAAGIGGSE